MSLCNSHQRCFVRSLCLSPLPAVEVNRRVTLRTKRTKAKHTCANSRPRRHEVVAKAIRQTCIISGWSASCASKNKPVTQAEMLLDRLAIDNTEPLTASFTCTISHCSLLLAATACCRLLPVIISNRCDQPSNAPMTAPVYWHD
jgi:hypothetical protein